MNKGIVSVILGSIGFLSIPFVSTLFSLGGLIFGLFALKSKSKNITIPVGYKGKINGKKTQVQPFISIKYLAIVGIIISCIGLVTSISSSIMTMLFLIIN